MIKFAITGNIAAGKSLVESYIKKFFPVIDSDTIAHEILEKKQNIIIESFKEFDICESGKINRKKLAKIVFENFEHKNKLEKILHPEIKNKILEFFKINEKEKYVFVSVPLLFETQFDKIFDKILFIYADDNIRLERLMKRNNLTKKDALLRLSSQISQEEKISKCDYIIKNENDKETLILNVKEFLNNLP